MQRLLEEREVALINDRLHDNALLRACQQIWAQRQEVVGVVAHSEDIFCESVWLMDELIDANDVTDIMRLVRGLWSTVVSDVSQWRSQSVSIPDRNLIATTIFQLVGIVFSLHWHSHFCEEIHDALLKIVDEKRPSPQTLFDQQQLERQQDELFENLIASSAMLNEWANEYIDNPSSWLTEEIELALKPPHIAIKVKPETQKEGRKTFNVDTFRETFTYVIEGMSSQERETRLKLGFNKMRGILIEKNTHYDTFESLFSSKPLDVKIVWTGTNAQLRMLFNLLVTKNKLVKKPTGGLNQILSARFIKPDGTSFTSEEIRNAGSDGDMSAVNEVVEYLTPKPVSLEDLEHQLKRLITEELERNELEGKKDGKYQRLSPTGTNISLKPNQHTRITKKRL